MNANNLHGPTLLFLLLFGSASSAAAQDAPSEETIEFFAANCMSCHTIGGGRLNGPDLKDVTTRQEKDWLVEFILDPQKVIDSGDPYAAALLRDARGTVMLDVPGVDATLAGKLVDLIVVESAKEKSRFAGLQISDRPLTAEDVEIGRKLFMGEQRFLEGAPACVSCHTVRDISGLGGGRLGPDLTHAFARLEGRKALGAWLGSPPSALMQPVFKNRPMDAEEILPLVAFLKEAGAGGEGEAAPNTLNFMLLGFGGAVALLLAFDFLWRRRYRAVRRPLTAGHRRSLISQP